MGSGELFSSSRIRMRIPKLLFRRKRYRLRLIFILGLTFLVISFIIFSHRENVESMLDFHMCPACFGMTLCPVSRDLEEVDLSLDLWGSLGTLANSITTKNVYTGHFKERKVIMKRLGRNDELHQLDSRICHAMGLHHSCDNEMKKIVHMVPNLREKVINLLSGLPTSVEKHRLTLCPSTEHMDLFFKPLFLSNNEFSHSGISNNNQTANIWTTLQINPEPLLLQIIRAEDGWPVPHYVGSCGRMVMMENAGTALVSFHSKPWPVRAGLALQLLLAADRFTYSHPHFAFYLLDISPDNIVVDNRGKLTFVDLEHIIVVDRHPPQTDLPKNWNDTHFSEVSEDCPGCYEFSGEDICSHHISDHNHFITCQQLLSPNIGTKWNVMPSGLLHSTPSQILQEYPQIQRFLSECSAVKSTDRVRSARRLGDALNIISKESPLFSDMELLKTWGYF